MYPLQFTEAWWVLAVILVVVSTGCGMMAAGDTKKFKKTAFAATFLLVYSFFNVFTVAFSSIDTGEEMRAPDIAATGFGLESGHPYPLVIGQLGNMGNIDVDAGYYSVHVSGRSGSSILIDFTHKETTFILQLPVDEVRFTKAATTTPTVTIHLTSGATFGPKETTQEPCRMVWESGYLACNRTNTVKTVVSPELQNAGLPPLVRDNLDRVEITLSPELLNQVFGITSN